MNNRLSTRLHSNFRGMCVAGFVLFAQLGFSGEVFSQTANPRPLPPPAVTPPHGIRPVPPNAQHFELNKKSSVTGKTPLAVYSIGDPTAEEQYVLELINRARANPAEEGDRLSTTNDPDITQAYIQWGAPTRQQVKTDFATYEAKPPLAFNAKLIAAARLHSKDMLDNNFQSHTGSNGSTVTQRVNAQGYGGSYIGENIFDYGKSMWDIHASFQIDFGNPNLGHRMNIMNFGDYEYSEIGIGILHGGTGSPNVGPIVTTEDFGEQGKRFITGVVYDDKNGNKFYDMGEGLAGITIKLSSGSSYTAVSSASGGYAIPYDGTGTVSVTATGTALGVPVTHSAELSGKNVKIDFSPDRTGFPSGVPLVAPTPDSIVKTDSVRLVWNKTALATKYHLEVATDEEMQTIILNDLNVTDTSKVIRSLKDSVRYYWRVTGINAKGAGPASGIASFLVKLPPPRLTLLSPADKSQQDIAQLNFNWRRGPSYTLFYRFELGTDKNMETSMVDSLVFDSVVTLSQFDYPWTLGTTYYWRATPVFEEGNGEPSVTRSFTLTSAGVNTNADHFTVSTASPNPTSGVTEIGFTLASQEEVSLVIFNSVGQKVETLISGKLAPRHYNILWNAAQQSPGTYFYQLRIGNRMETGHIAVVK